MSRGQGNWPVGWECYLSPHPVPLPWGEGNALLRAGLSHAVAVIPLADGVNAIH